MSQTIQSPSEEFQTDSLTDTANNLIIQSLAKLDVFALGISLGVFFGLVIFVATNVLVLRGGDVIGPNLALLNHYFIGYEVTLIGSLSGFFYGFVTGFVLGSLIALLRNTIVSGYLHILKIKNRMSAVNDFIDNP